jgi:hypothetical protein
MLISRIYKLKIIDKIVNTLRYYVPGEFANNVNRYAFPISACSNC